MRKNILLSKEDGVKQGVFKKNFLTHVYPHKIMTLLYYNNHVLKKYTVLKYWET